MSTAIHLQEPEGEPPRLDARLVAWLADRMQTERHARLVDGGADVDEHLDLTAVFIDLPAATRFRSDPPPDHAEQLPALRRLLGVRTGETSSTLSRRWLVVGGPGSGKSTLTQMLAQQLRMPWLEQQAADLPAKLRERIEPVRSALAELADKHAWQRVEGFVPLRVSLPALAQWLAGRAAPHVGLSDFVADRMSQDLRKVGEVEGDVSAPALRELIDSLGKVAWILDGLDEVPASAARDQLVAIVRDTIHAQHRKGDGVLVSTREQGYQGEFDELDELLLLPLEMWTAIQYAESLLRAWRRDEHIEAMRSDFYAVTDLLTTPLHATMAALLVARNPGGLPKARYALFNRYFKIILDRELAKRIAHDVQPDDENILRSLHARAGLLLHVRAQRSDAARPTLRRRELRDILVALFFERKHEEERARAHAERILRFAELRLVLLLGTLQGEYEFGIRSLQEFFAAEAILIGPHRVVCDRLNAIATSPHWLNVLAFVVSKTAQDETLEIGEAIARTVGLCEGVKARSSAASGLMSTHLAVHMLRETQHYGEPWLHDPLWQLALDGVMSAPVWPATDPAKSEWSLAAEFGLVAAVLIAREENSKYKAQLLEFAGRAMSGDGYQAQRGWMLLHGWLLVSPESPEPAPDVLALADTHAPGNRMDAGLVADALTGNVGLWAPSWLGQFVGAHPDLLPSKSVRHLRGLEGSAVRTVIQHIMKHHNNAVYWWIEKNRAISIGSIYVTYDGPNVANGPHARRWHYLACFLKSPSPESLADYLATLDDEQALTDAQNLILDEESPWPLDFCLSSVQSTTELRALCEALREHRLGTLEAWQAAETRWGRSVIVTLEDALGWLHTDGPWNPDIGEHGCPLPAYPVVLEMLGVQAREAFIEQMCRLLASGTLSPSKRHFLHKWVLTDQPMPLRLARLLPPRQDGVWCVGTRAIGEGLTSEEAEGWLDLLDERGRRSPVVRTTDFFHAKATSQVAARIIEQLRNEPMQWGLLAMLEALVEPELDLSGLEFPSLPPEIPAHIARADAFLRILADEVEGVPLHDLLARTEVQLGSLAWHIAHRPIHERTHTYLDAIVAYIDSVPFDAPAREDLSEHKAVVLDAIRSVELRTAPAVFDSAQAWSDHQLRGPWLEPPQHLRPPRLRRISELTNIRLFKTTPTIDVDFPIPQGDVGQWIVLIGENGVGKTTLLRSLALALATPAVASKLLDEQVSMVRNGGEGRIALELDTGTLSVTVSRGDRTEHVEASEETTKTNRPWVVGYGVRRGNARGEEDRTVRPGAIGELHLLFEGPASPHNAMRWLAELDADVLREQRRMGRGPEVKPGPRGQTWTAVRHALQPLIGIHDLEVDEGGQVYVTHEKFGRVRLDALSDGYLTTVGWVIDMIARWIDRQNELDEPVGSDVLHQMTGFVFIDEIDLHLHPTWQLTILDDIRRLFPRMSFVVTTHNPLTLHGARPGEIYVMRHAEGGGIELVQRDIRPGHDVDRVLFDQFGVKATFDAETRALLDEHSALVLRGVGRDDVRRVQLERRLRARFGDLTGTIEDERERGLGPSRPLPREQVERALARYPKRSKPGVEE